MSNSSRSIRLALAALSLAIPGAAALAAPLFGATVLAGLGSSAADINSSGAVVGQYLSGAYTHGFLYSGSSLTDLGTLGGGNSFANSINNYGAIVGGADTAGGNSHAFLYTGGSMSDLGTLGGSTSVANGISNNGYIAGSSAVAAPSEPALNQQAFSYSGGSMHALGTLPGGAASNAQGINNAGLAVGSSFEGPVTMPEYPYYAVAFQGGTVQDLGTLHTGDSIAYDVNDAGLIVGGMGTPATTHNTNAFLYDHGVLTNLGVLDLSENDSVAYGVNGLGQVVGTSTVTLDPDHYGYHGFLYTASGGMQDLDSLVSLPAGWHIVSASAINDAEQIAATACNTTSGNDCMAVRLDLLSPIPEPGTWAMLVAGLGLFGLGRRRFR